MNNHFIFVMSICFALASYAAAGYLFKRLIRYSQLSVAESILTGSGLIALITYFVSMVKPDYLFLVSIGLMVLSLVGALLLLLQRVIKNKYQNGVNNDKSVYLILLLMIVPLLLGTLNCPFWGDELNGHAPMVRYWLEKKNFFIDPSVHYTTYAWPKLWAIMIYHTLCLGGTLHEAAGRWLSIVMILIGALFVWQEFTRSFGFNKWISLVWASFWLPLVFIPMFAWSASWYYSMIMAVLVMFLFYHIVMARKEGSLDLKQVAVSSVLMSMIIVVRPDGFTYLPIAVLLLFHASFSFFRSNVKQNILALLLFLVPPLVVYFSWTCYISSNDLYIPGPQYANPLVTAGRVDTLMEKALPVITIMLKNGITEWYMVGLWYFCLLICFILAIKLYKHLETKEKQILLLLLLPLYKFVYMIFANSMYLPRVRMGRHIMQTAPLLYLVLGFLLIKWVNLRYGDAIKRIPQKLKLVSMVIILSAIFTLQSGIGALYAHLPAEMNNYMEHWTDTIKSKFPQHRSVQLVFSRYAPPTTRLHIVWRYYSCGTPDFFSSLTPFIIDIRENNKISNKSEYLEVLEQEGVDAILVYGADDEIRNILELELDEDKTYLIEPGNGDFEVVCSEKIPFSDIWVVPWRTKAVKRLIHVGY
jgi:hypothetical protein